MPNFCLIWLLLGHCINQRGIFKNNSLNVSSNQKLFYAHKLKTLQKGHKLNQKYSTLCPVLPHLPERCPCFFRFSFRPNILNHTKKQFLSLQAFFPSWTFCLILERALSRGICHRCIAIFCSSSLCLTNLWLDTFSGPKGRENSGWCLTNTMAEIVAP